MFFIVMVRMVSINNGPSAVEISVNDAAADSNHLG